jgi:hypothetical protein
VFGSETAPLLTDSITFTVNALYGGGAGIGGVQVLGEGQAGANFKTPIPIPVLPALASITRDTTTAEISLEGLLPEVTYALEEAAPLASNWNRIAQVSEATAWSTNVATSSPASFYRSASTNRVERLELPLSP